MTFVTPSCPSAAVITRYPTFWRVWAMNIHTLALSSIISTVVAFLIKRTAFFSSCLNTSTCRSKLLEDPYSTPFIHRHVPLLQRNHPHRFKIVQNLHNNPNRLTQYVCNPFGTSCSID